MKEKNKNFKVGDMVRVVASVPVDLPLGAEFTVTKDSYYSDGEEYVVVNDDTHGGWYARRFELIKTKENKMTSIIEKIKLATKGEPEKSCIKAGILNSDETFTDDGQEVFLSWLFKKYGAEFKKDVVDPILAEQEKE